MASLLFAVQGRDPLLWIWDKKVWDLEHRILPMQLWYQISIYDASSASVDKRSEPRICKRL
jgi:hypothetical protein